MVGSELSFWREKLWVDDRYHLVLKKYGEK
jgi:hypothetical protein